MSAGVNDLDLPDCLQPPMANGEVLFDAPWQGRVFAMAVSLSAAGVFAWAEFQTALIDAIDGWERALDGRDRDAGYPYYELFAAALERVLDERGLVSVKELESRREMFAARPHGHDHEHLDTHGSAP